MILIDFLIEHWVSLLVVVIFLAILAVLAARGKKQIVYKMLYALVREAEERYGDGAGKLRFAEVMTKIYTMLPPILKLFITYDTLEAWIEAAVAQMKEELGQKAGQAPA